MALIKKSELASMNIEQLKTKLAELKKEMIKINMQIASHTTPENPGKIKATKKMIARIIALISQKRTTKKEEKRKKHE